MKSGEEYKGEKDEDEKEREKKKRVVEGRMDVGIIIILPATRHQYLNPSIIL